MNVNDWYYSHLRKEKLRDKDLFIQASLDIEHSFTGRADILTLGLHRFFLESSKLIRNAIKLYEEGVFDAAFYSIRSALELARVVTYLSDKNELNDDEVYKNWKTGGKFPFDSTIRKELEESGNVYMQVREVLSDFFDNQKEWLRLIQKYIHKQGYITFYERGFVSKEKEDKRQQVIAKDFYQFIKNSLTEIALLRLCIDPFPILLRDEKIMYKIHFESMTGPFNNDFIQKIIGEDKIELYCGTEFYKTHIEYFAENEELSEEMHAFINYQHYDRKKWNKIKSQLHLLPKRDIAIIKLFHISNVIARIYMFKGLSRYSSDIHSLRRNVGFSSEDLLKVKNADKKVNSIYDEAFLSYFYFDGDDLWIEHNEPLNKLVIAKIEDTLIPSL